MRQRIIDLWRYSFGSPDDPIYRKERTGWTYMQLLQTLNKGCLPIILLAVFIVPLGCGLVALVFEPNCYLFAAGAIVGMFFLAALIDWVTGLIATALTATSISAEIESETFDVLRATNRTPHQIVIAKFGAAIRQLHLPIFIPLGLRAMGVLIALLIAAIALVLQLDLNSTILPDTAEITSFLIGQFETRVWGQVAFLGSLAFLIYILTLLTLPVLRTMFFAAIGMLGSSLAKTRANGLLAAIGLRIGIWFVGYTTGQVLSFAVSFGLGSISSVAQGGQTWATPLMQLATATYIQFGLFSFIIYMLAYLAGQTGLILGMLWFSEKRVEKIAVSH